MRLENDPHLVKIVQRFEKVEIGFTEPVNQRAINIPQKLGHLIMVCGGVKGDKKPERVAFNVSAMLEERRSKAFGVVAGSIKGEPLITVGPGFGIAVLQFRFEGTARCGVEQDRGDKCQYEGQTSGNRRIDPPRLLAPT
jgi:hypothetical protein